MTLPTGPTLPTRDGDEHDTRPAPRIGRRTAIAMIVAFVALIAIPPVHQVWFELSRTGRWRFLTLFDSFPTHASLREFEDSLARESVLGTETRKLYRENLLRWFGQGNEKILFGRDGFLFYLEEVEMAAGPGFLGRRAAMNRKGEEAARKAPTDASDAIADFSHRLREAGIHLVFVPLPVKPFVYPERVWPGYPAQSGPAWNRDREPFKARITEAGVDVLDVTDDLWAAKGGPDGDLFLKLDTHWTPHGVAIAADRIAAHVRPMLGTPGETVFATRRQRVTNYGDMLRVLEVEPSSGLFAPQAVEIVQVFRGDTLAAGDDASPVLLLGDSFSNIYRRREMEWGEGAGLGEQLMLRLGLGVQVIAINGGGATAVRETLAMRPAALEHKRVVVWACTARDLFDPSIVWERVPLPSRADRGTGSSPKRRAS